MSRCSKGFLALILIVLFCERKEYLNPYDPINLPPAPYLQEPRDDSTSTDNPPYFVWDIIEDTLNPFFGDPLFYELRIDTSDDFTSPEFSIANIPMTGFSPNHIFGDDTYYWQIRARYNDGGWSEWSPAWRFDVRFPLIASCAKTGNGDMVTAHDRIYMISNGDLAIINVSNPYAPYLVQTYHDSTFIFNHIFISGQYLYATQTGYYGSLAVFSLENPDHPAYINHLPLFYPRDLWIDNNRAYVLTNTYSLVIDVFPADSLVIIDSLSSIGSCIVVDNNYAFIGGNDIYIIDLLTGRIVATLPPNTSEMYVIEDYLITRGSSIQIYDISNIRNPIEISNIQILANHIIVTDDFLFLDHEGVIVYDLSDFSAPRQLGVIRVLRGPFCIDGIFLMTGHPEYTVIKYE